MFENFGFFNKKAKIEDGKDKPEVLKKEITGLRNPGNDFEVNPQTGLAEKKRTVEEKMDDRELGDKHNL
jgi:hypothetical protein